MHFHCLEHTWQKFLLLLLLLLNVVVVVVELVGHWVVQRGRGPASPSGWEWCECFRRFATAAVSSRPPTNNFGCKHFTSKKDGRGPRHGSSDGRAGELRLKRPGFNPCLDPMRLCFTIYGEFVLYILGWLPRCLVWWTQFTKPSTHVWLILQIAKVSCNFQV